MPDRAGTPTRAQRRRYLTAELLVQLAMTVQQWGNAVVDDQPDARPFDQWPASDPLRELVDRHGLSRTDVQRVCSELAGRLEQQAERSGYDRIPLAT